jgi:hypothetical protein
MNRWVVVGILLLIVVAGLAAPYVGIHNRALGLVWLFAFLAAGVQIVGAVIDRWRR